MKQYHNFGWQGDHSHVVCKDCHLSNVYIHAFDVDCTRPQGGNLYQPAAPMTVASVIEQLEHELSCKNLKLAMCCEALGQYLVETPGAPYTAQYSIGGCSVPETNLAYKAYIKLLDEAKAAKVDADKHSEILEGLRRFSGIC